MTGNGYAVWLYGSHSRGTADEFSDLDVLFVSEAELMNVKALEPFGSAATFSISWYSWPEIEEMASYGSLFLRHVELEGRVILESAPARGRLMNILSTLGPYRMAQRDIRGFRTVLQDVIDSVADGQASLTFEVATLGTVFRHASILGCALDGTPCFSRTEPVEKVVSAWRLPKRWATEFPRLYGYRLYAEGRSPRRLEPNLGFVWTWCRRTHMLLDALEEQVDRQA